MPAFLNQGLTAVRNQVKTLVSHIGVSTDSAAFAATQTVLDPTNVGASNNLIQASTDIDVDLQTFDSEISFAGSLFADKTIFTIGLLQGGLRTDCLTRHVRSVGIGVLSGDTWTITVRARVQDDT